MPRLFIAIELPDELKQALSGLQHGIPGLRWVPREQLHLTLAFLGDVPGDLLAMLKEALGRLEVRPMTLRLTHPGCFPRRGQPRVLWYGLEGQPALERLAQRVKETVAACGISTEERPFSPHITLARVKSPLSSAALKDYLAKDLGLQVPAFEVRQITLFQSTLTQLGAIHEPVMLFPG